MFNKKRIFVFIVFLLLLFFLMTFGGGRGQNAAIATRTVTFTDGYNMKDIAKYEVEVGKDAVVPEVPVHVGYVFTGWYDFENQSVKVTNFKYILEDLHVLAKYSRDANGNGIPDEDDDYFEYPSSRDKCLEYYYYCFARDVDGADKRWDLGFL